MENNENEKKISELDETLNNISFLIGKLNVDKLIIESELINLNNMVINIINEKNALLQENDQKHKNQPQLNTNKVKL